MCLAKSDESDARIFLGRFCGRSRLILTETWPGCSWPVSGDDVGRRHSDPPRTDHPEPEPGLGSPKEFNHVALYADDGDPDPAEEPERFSPETTSWPRMPRGEAAALDHLRRLRQR